MKNTHTILHIVLYLLLCSITLGKKNKDDIKNKSYPPCKACKVVVESFDKGMERTNRGKFEGGDAAWEEDKLGSYKTSEMRLIEIQEGLCKEVDHGQNQCYSLIGDWEHFIEEWWFKHQKDSNLFTFLCVESTQNCCPDNHYGKDCQKCPGYPDNICNNNGKCKGAGTRLGNGKCNCDKGYSGEYCFECADGFYQSYKDEKKLLCSPCHRACKGACKGGGAKECHECNPGWREIEGQGCYDIDECVEKDDSCPKNHFCVNNEGNFSCLACDRACDGCSGDGPDMCDKCAEGFNKKGNLCVNTDILGRKSTENWARYVTYLGLTVATCIILQRNVYAAGVIGLFVAIYISVSEYMIAHGNISDTTPSLDIVDKHS
ncbi:hypothetical protein QAD02_015067 [Eretmocerus hayati]|uniref:Uncharacterized protein n=1 Tax=Eretmocerus hayati TaxID=131215 RepID=A0ACC2P781_9HYME|nr:hypothetical protein QAD02_015067 [Eretmocerus hayati]